MLESRVAPAHLRLFPLLRRWMRDFDTLRGDDLVWRVMDSVMLLYMAPFALVGLVALIVVTDLSVFWREWPVVLLVGGLMILFSRLEFFAVNRVSSNGLSVSFNVSLEMMVTWSGVLLVGPTILWLQVLSTFLLLIINRLYVVTPGQQWNLLRNVCNDLTTFVTSTLLCQAVYVALGGQYPLTDLQLNQILPAFAAQAVWVLLIILIEMPLRHYINLRILLMFAVIMGLTAPFGVLAAAIYSRIGVGIYLFYMAGLLMTALLANRLSRAIERSRQRSRELESLEALGRDIINAPADGSDISGLLARYVPHMFPRTDIEIRVFPDRHLFVYPPERTHAAESFWRWFQNNPQPTSYNKRRLLPWNIDQVTKTVVTVPILDPEKHTPIGAIYMVVGNIYAKWDRTSGASLIPALQTLAAQIASGLNRAKVYAQNLQHEKIAQELTLAGNIQNTFLPKTLPEIPGWQLCAMLEPARQTSGDFYDVIPLPNGNLGIVVADVADKGLGAALLMALSRTLMRIYAAEYFSRPDLVLQAVNHRILQDTKSDLFVTMLYAILNPRTGELDYTNAGHNPPYVIGNGQARKLVSKGVPLGMFADMRWKHERTELAPGELLLLYTDGITESQNHRGDFFGEERMLRCILSHANQPVEAIKDGLLHEIKRFVGGAPQYDDVTLVLTLREQVKLPVQKATFDMGKVQ